MDTNKTGPTGFSLARVADIEGTAIAAGNTHHMLGIPHVKWSGRQVWARVDGKNAHVIYIRRNGDYSGLYEIIPASLLVQDVAA